MKDIAIVDTLNGGDLVFAGNDFATVSGIENMIYLALFGGNVGAPTKKKNSDTEQSFDWWGNTLLLKEYPEAQFNSFTEKKLQDVALNSKGRIEIENTIKKDLEFLNPYANITVSAVIVSDDNLRVNIKAEILDSDFSVVKVLTYNKADGDFSYLDFNDDFF